MSNDTSEDDLISALTNRALMAELFQRRLYKSSRHIRTREACHEAAQLTAEMLAQFVSDPEYRAAVREALE